MYNKVYNTGIIKNKTKLDSMWSSVCVGPRKCSSSNGVYHRKYRIKAKQVMVLICLTEIKAGIKPITGG